MGAEPMAIRKERAARFAIAGAAVLGLLKLVTGLLIGSIGLISAAIDSLVDVLISTVNLFSIRLAESPADAGHPYGHGKVENLAGLLQAGVIGVMGGWVIAEAIRRLLRGVPIQHVDWGIAVILVSIGGSWLIAWRLRRTARETDSVILLADSYHYATDIWTGLGVLAALVLIRLTGIPLFDPLIAIGVGGLILGAAGKIARRSIWDLMDSALPAHEQGEIDRIIRRHAFVLSYHDLRTRRSGSRRLIDFSVVLCRHLPLGETHDLVDHIEKEIEAGVPHSDVVIHPEPCPEGCPATEHCVLTADRPDLFAHQRVPDR